MKIPNVNCRQYSSFGQCMHPGKENIFWFFRPECVLINDPSGNFCMIQEKYERPNAPPAPIPPVGRDIKEGEQPPKPKGWNDI